MGSGDRRFNSHRARNSTSSPLAFPIAPLRMRPQGARLHPDNPIGTPKIETTSQVRSGVVWRGWRRAIGLPIPSIRDYLPQRIWHASSLNCFFTFSHSTLDDVYRKYTDIAIHRNRNKLAKWKCFRGRKMTLKAFSLATFKPLARYSVMAHRNATVDHVTDIRKME